MNSKNRRRVACVAAPSVSFVAFAFASSLTGCGSYDEAIPATPGGAAGQVMNTVMANAPGQTAGGGQAGMASAGMASAGAGGSTSTGGSAALPISVTPVEASCDNVTPCGGDVVGTWAVAGSCLPVAGEADMSGFGLGCSAAPVTGALEVSGTFTANADGTFSDQTITAGSSEISLPPSCLDVSGTVTTCARVGSPLQALGFASVTCVDAADGGCTCSADSMQTGGLAVVSLDAATTGTYSVAGNVLTATTRAALDYAYCVAGNTLTLSPQTVSKTGLVTGAIVMQKQ